MIKSKDRRIDASSRLNIKPVEWIHAIQMKSRHEMTHFPLSEQTWQMILDTRCIWLFSEPKELRKKQTITILLIHPHSLKWSYFKISGYLERRCEQKEREPQMTSLLISSFWYCQDALGLQELSHNQDVTSRLLLCHFLTSPRSPPLLH